MKWSYGVTTVPERRLDLLPRTLASLTLAGFGDPRLFVDGAAGGTDWSGGHDPVTFRYPKVRTYGNWLLSLLELYIREPAADRYAVFQDDLVACKSLRGYLDRTAWPAKGYLNLYSFPVNEAVAPAAQGFYRGAELTSGPNLEGTTLRFQKGRGAVALCFPREAVLTLLASPGMYDRVNDRHRGWRSADGAVVTAMNRAGWSEYCHQPGLVQHTGERSSMGNQRWPASASFPGEDFDCSDFLK